MQGKDEQQKGVQPKINQGPGDSSPIGSHHLGLVYDSVINWVHCCRHESDAPCFVQNALETLHCRVEVDCLFSNDPMHIANRMPHQKQAVVSGS